MVLCLFLFVFCNSKALFDSQMFLFPIFVVYKGKAVFRTPPIYCFIFPFLSCIKVKLFFIPIQFIVSSKFSFAIPQQINTGAIRFTAAPLLFPSIKQSTTPPLFSLLQQSTKFSSLPPFLRTSHKINCALIKMFLFHPTLGLAASLVYQKYVYILYV